MPTRLRRHQSHVRIFLERDFRKVHSNDRVILVQQIQRRNGNLFDVLRRRNLLIVVILALVAEHGREKESIMMIK